MYCRIYSRSGHYGNQYGMMFKDTTASAEGGHGSTMKSVSRVSGAPAPSHPASKHQCTDSNRYRVKKKAPTHGCAIQIECFESSRALFSRSIIIAECWMAVSSSLSFANGGVKLNGINCLPVFEQQRRYSLFFSSDWRR